MSIIIIAGDYMKIVTMKNLCIEYEFTFVGYVVRYNRATLNLWKSQLDSTTTTTKHGGSSHNIQVR